MDLFGISRKRKVLLESVDEMRTVYGSCFHTDFHFRKSVASHGRHNTFYKLLAARLRVGDGKHGVFGTVRLHQIGNIAVACDINTYVKWIQLSHLLSFVIGGQSVW